MANEKEAGAVKSGQLVRLLPEQIVVKSGENGRYIDPDRRPLIIKILVDGRVTTPLKVRKIEQNQVQLVAGYGRHAAVTFINAHLTDGVLEAMLAEAGREGVVVPTQPMKLPVIAEPGMSAAEAFYANISENDDRAGTTHVDKAFNIRRAIQVYGMSEDQARYLYPDANGKPKSPAWVSQMLKITTLSKEILQDIVTGERSANVAFALADMPEEARAEVLALAKQQAEETGTPVTATSVVAAARKKGVKTGKVGRKMSELKQLLKDATLPGLPYHCREYNKTLLAWIEDELEATDADKIMSRAFRNRFKESPKDDA